MASARTAITAASPEGKVPAPSEQLDRPRLRLRGPPDQVPVDLDLHAHLGERRQVAARKGHEVVVSQFLGSVPPDEAGPEVDRHLGDVVGPGEDDRRDDVLATIGAHVPHRELGAGEDHGLGQPVQQEAEGRGGVGHGVGAVEHHEAVVVVVAPDHGAGDPDPIVGPHLGAVEERLHPLDGDLGHLPTVQLGHRRQGLLDEPFAHGQPRASGRHADGSARVQQTDAPVACRHG